MRGPKHPNRPRRGFSKARRDWRSNDGECDPLWTHLIPARETSGNCYGPLLTYIHLRLLLERIRESVSLRDFPRFRAALGSLRSLFGQPLPREIGRRTPRNPLDFEPLRRGRRSCFVGHRRALALRGSRRRARRISRPPYVPRPRNPDPRRDRRFGRFGKR